MVTGLRSSRGLGFVPERITVWVLEDILYNLPHLHAMQVLQSVATYCALTPTILLANFMNKSSHTPVPSSIVTVIGQIICCLLLGFPVLSFHRSAILMPILDWCMTPRTCSTRYRTCPDPYRPIRRTDHLVSACIWWKPQDSKPGYIIGDQSIMHL